MEGVVDVDAARQDGLRDVQHFAAVGPVAVLGNVTVELVLEADVVPRGRVEGWCCEAPALVELAGAVVAPRVFVQVVLGDLVELAADGVRDGFYDFAVFGGCGGGGQVLP